MSRAAPASFAAFSSWSQAKNTASPDLRLALFRDFPLRFGGKKFGDWAFACKSADLAVEDDIAEPRRAFALRPIVEFVEKGARLSGRAGRRNGPHDAARLDDSS